MLTSLPILNLKRYSSTMNQFQDSPQEQDFTVVNVPVPTFRNENSLLQAAGINEREQADKLDAFLFYSDDEVRMRTLSGGIVGAEQRQNSTPTPTPTQDITRKTRISFELHPCVFMEDFLLSNESFSDNEEAAGKAMNDDPYLHSISELYANIRAPRAA